MAPKQIKNLVVKYWEGNTSPEEEATLKRWYTPTMRMAQIQKRSGIFQCWEILIK